MKTIKINNDQYGMLMRYEGVYNNFLNECVKNNTILMESSDSLLKKGELLEGLIDNLKENNLDFAIKGALVEATLHLNASPLVMLESALKKGFGKEEVSQLVPEFIRKGGESDEFMTEDIINEAMVNSLVQLLKKAASMKGVEGIKKTLITMVMAGKLATMSTAAIAGAAESAGMDPVEAQHLKVELDATKKSGKDVKIDNAKKKEMLSTIEGSFIETPDGNKLPFKYDGSYDSFESVNKDNYPEFNVGSKEYETLKAAFASPNPVKGTCYFKTTGGVKKFMGEFINANGLWYRYIPSETPPKKEQGVSDPTPSVKTPVDNTVYGKEMEKMAMDDFSGLFRGAKQHWDYLNKIKKKPNMGFAEFVTDFLRKNDDRLSHLTDQQISNLFQDGFKINLRTIPQKK
jgi:hypothetical protein